MKNKPPQPVLDRLKLEGYKFKKSDWFFVPDPEGQRWFGYLNRKEDKRLKFYAVTISTVTGMYIAEILASYHVFRVKNECEGNRKVT